MALITTAKTARPTRHAPRAALPVLVSALVLVASPGFAQSHSGSSGANASSAAAHSRLSAGDRALGNAVRAVRLGGRMVRAIGRPIARFARRVGPSVGRAVGATVAFGARHTWNNSSRVKAAVSVVGLRAYAPAVALVDRAKLVWSTRNDPQVDSRAITQKLPARRYTLYQTRFERHNGERMRVQTERTFLASAHGNLALESRQDHAKRSYSLMHEYNFGTHSAKRTLTRNARGGLDAGRTFGWVGYNSSDIRSAYQSDDGVAPPAPHDGKVTVRLAGGNSQSFQFPLPTARFN